MTEPRLDTPSSLPASVRISAPAKVNLILRILDRRSDGYHNLWSLMETVGLEDELAISLNRNHSEIRLHCGGSDLRSDPTNLVYRAALAVRDRINQKPGLEIVLTKRIPLGAGLGGGSSDAAATIMALNTLLDLGWSPTQMAAVGEPLGSDVPFFFFGPSAVVSGRGEQVQPVALNGHRWFVLVNPGFPVETKWAYHELAATRAGVAPLSPGHAALQNARTVTWDHLVTLTENDFERPVLGAHPVLREIKMRLLAEGAETALLSGSGATVFGVFKEERDAHRVAASYEGHLPMQAYAVPALSRLPTCRA